LQFPGQGNSQRVCAGGRSMYTLPLAYAGISQGISAIFLECHPQPELAWCDGACALPLSSLDYVVEQIVQLDCFIKANPPKCI
jgi:2-dehydro-3-deoxyphosphooctonate aldolase (KDO 8-P synthase)